MPIGNMLMRMSTWKRRGVVALLIAVMLFDGPYWGGGCNDPKDHNLTGTSTSAR